MDFCFTVYFLKPLRVLYCFNQETGLFVIEKDFIQRLIHRNGDTPVTGKFNQGLNGVGPLSKIIETLAHLLQHKLRPETHHDTVVHTHGAPGAKNLPGNVLAELPVSAVITE